MRRAVLLCHWTTRWRPSYSRRASATSWASRELLFKRVVRSHSSPVRGPAMPDSEPAVPHDSYQRRSGYRTFRSARCRRRRASSSTSAKGWAQRGYDLEAPRRGRPSFGGDPGHYWVNSQAEPALSTQTRTDERDGGILLGRARRVGWDPQKNPRVCAVPPIDALLLSGWRFVKLRARRFGSVRP